MKLRTSRHLLLFSLTGLLTLFAQVLGTSGQNTTVAAEKIGTCPDTEPAVAGGNCTEECQSDANCEGSQKCCQSGCGTSCKNPNGKPGSCPDFSPISGLGICASNCSEDSDCKDDQKCCTNGCGRLVCTNPTF